MSDRIDLSVVGIPGSQGSKTRMPNGAMVEGGSATGRAKLAEWRRAVADQARTAAADHGTIDEPVSVWAEFRFPSPKSDPYRHWHASKPDVDKTTRATLDALVSGGLLADDRLVVHLEVSKLYARPGEAPGADLSVGRLGAMEAAMRAGYKASAAARRKESA